MNIKEARLYLEHTSKDDFNLEEWQKENRYEAIQVILQEIERLNNQLEKYKYLYNRLSNKSEYTIKCLNKELQQKENIIKEVREYIDKYSRYCSNKEYFSTRNPISDLKIILDKEVN